MTHYMVKCRTIDGTQYLTGTGWCGDPRHALVMSEEDAFAIASRERAKCPIYQDADNGRFGIRATPYNGPYLYTLADYDADEREQAALDELYRDYAGQEEG